MPIIIPTKTREIYSTAIDINIFISMMYNNLHNHKKILKYIKFSNTIHYNNGPWYQANLIDTHIGDAITIAKQACYTNPQLPWSEKPHHASLSVQFWSIAKVIRPITKKNNEALQEIKRTMALLP